MTSFTSVLLLNLHPVEFIYAFQWLIRIAFCMYIPLISSLHWIHRVIMWLNILCCHLLNSCCYHIKFPASFVSHSSRFITISSILHTTSCINSLLPQCNFFAATLYLNFDVALDLQWQFHHGKSIHTWSIPLGTSHSI